VGDGYPCCRGRIHRVNEHCANDFTLPERLAKQEQYELPRQVRDRVSDFATVKRSDSALWMVAWPAATYARAFMSRIVHPLASGPSPAQPISTPRALGLPGLVKHAANVGMTGFAATCKTKEQLLCEFFCGMLSRNAENRASHLLWGSCS
jgi:hypothetical protein